MSRDLERQLAGLRQGEHLGVMYQDAAEGTETVVALIRAGLGRREAALYLADAPSHHRVEQALRDGGVEPAAEAARGALLLWSGRGDAGPSEMPDPRALATRLRREIDGALASGFAGLRVILEMSSLLGDQDPRDRLVQYEARLSELFPGSRALGACLYHLHGMPAAVLRRALLIHPRLLLEGEMHPNPFYQPPESLLSPDADARAVDWIISRLRQAREVERQIPAPASDADPCGHLASYLLLQAADHMRRLDLERTVAAISSRFVGAYDLDEAIDASLAQMGKTGGADRSYLIVVRPDRKVTDNTHEWCAEGVTPQKENLQGIPLSATPWSIARLRAGEIIHLPDVSLMPPEAAAERELLEGQEIRSILAIPLFVAGRFEGFVGFDNVREAAAWRREDLELLRVCSDLLGRAIERGRAQEALRESEALLRGLADNMLDVVTRLDRNGVVSYVSPSVKAVSGFEPGEMVGLCVFDYVHPEDLQPVLAAFGSAVATGFPARLELRMRNAAGEWVWLETAAKPVLEKGGRVAGLVLASRDVTQRRQLQDQLLRAQRLEAAGRIAGRVAHDFNNLLGPLVAYPDLIKMRLPAGHPVLPLCDLMMEAAQQMAEINTDMMVLGRRGLLERLPVELNRLVRQAVAEQTGACPLLAVELELAADLLPVAGSPSEILRALSNLIANAREAMREVGRLTLRTENLYLDQPLAGYNRVEMGEYVRFSVADTGCGIPEEIRSRIFDAFFSTRRSASGRGGGLGLAVVQAVVGDHGGYVDLETRPGLGTTFFVYLPARREPVGREGAEGLRGGTESILVVDDDGLQRQVARELLESLGYRVELAAGGEEAVARLMEQPADLLLLDMVMHPGIDGAESYRRVLGERPGQRTILVSGFAPGSRLQEAQALGAGAFLRKPLILETLAAAVRAELDR